MGVCMHKEAYMQRLSLSRKGRCMHQLSCYLSGYVTCMRSPGKAVSWISIHSTHERIWSVMLSALIGIGPKLPYLV